jgi:hypothetical protein
MKSIITFLLLAFILSDCRKKNDPERESTAISDNLAGSWMLVGQETTVDGKKVWGPVPTAQKNVFTIRYDGVLLDDAGLPFCCGPSSFLINGVPFQIVPREKVPENPTCAFVSCAACPTWEIEYQPNEIIVSYCGAIARAKFTRVLYDK